MNRTITINAPTRIHFGLFSVSPENGIKFGGAGIMLKNPNCQLQLTPAEQFSGGSEHSDLIWENARRWWDGCQDFIADHDHLEDLPLRLELKHKPPSHCGFGTGTQIAMSIAAAMYRAFEMPIPSARLLATTMGRGQRSAIGTYGFLKGGFLVDRGVDVQANIAELDVRFQIPTDWRVVLFVPRMQIGMHGSLENKTFSQLQQNSVPNRHRMIEICNGAIAPAIASGSYSDLGEPLYEFNRLSGQYFSDYQFGCYHSEACSQIVEQIRGCGIRAVGQSSWGPCIFAVTQNVDDANDLVAQLRAENPDIYSASNIDIIIAEPDNWGATTSVQNLSTDTDTKP